MAKTLTEEIFAVGTWNGMEFTVEDLQLIAYAFAQLKDIHQIPLANIKIGHNEEQSMTDGQPALGWVDEVFVQGEKLMAKLVDIPDIVAEAIEKKLYKNKSIELDLGVEHDGSFYPYVLSGIALLGADIPAVNTLNDLGVLMSRSSKGNAYKKRATFSSVANETKNRSINMSDSEDLKTLKAQLAASEEARTKLVTDNTALKQTEIENKVQFAANEAIEAHRLQAEERGLLVTRLEGMVKAQKIAPHTRTTFMSDYDQAEDKKQIVFMVEKLEETIDANPAYFGAEQARKLADQKAGENDKPAGDVVVTRTREYMHKHGEKSFTVAKTAVLKADAELATRYTKMEA